MAPSSLFPVVLSICFLLLWLSESFSSSYLPFIIFFFISIIPIIIVFFWWWGEPVVLVPGQAFLLTIRTVSTCSMFTMCSLTSFNIFRWYAGKGNEYCFRPQFCTVRLHWTGVNLGKWDEFVINHDPGAGLIARPVDQQSCTLPLYHGCTLMICLRGSKGSILPFHKC